MLVIKNLPTNAGDTRDMGLISGWGISPEGEHWQTTPVLLPRKSHEQRSLTSVYQATKSQT